MPDIAAGGSQKCSFRAQKLGDLPVESTKWTIAAPRGLQVLIVGANAMDLRPEPRRSASSGGIAALWQRFVEDGTSPVSTVTSDPEDEIQLECRSSRSQTYGPRLAAIAGIIAVAAISTRLIHRNLLHDWFACRRYLSGVSIGVVWWLWFSPSVIGLVIVLLVLLRRFLPWRRLAAFQLPLR